MLNNAFFLNLILKFIAANGNMLLTKKIAVMDPFPQSFCTFNILNVNAYSFQLDFKHR